MKKEIMIKCIIQPLHRKLCSNCLLINGYPFEFGASWVTIKMKNENNFNILL